MALAFLKERLKGDRVIWLVIAILTAFSIAGVYSTTLLLAFKKADGNTEFFLLKHALLISGSLALMYFVHRIPYRKFLGYGNIALLICIPVQALTPLIGETVNGASRRLPIPIIGQTIQPSDFIKIATVIYLAAFLSKYQNSLEEMRRRIWIPLAIITLSAAMIYFSNLSTALMLIMTCGALMLVGRAPLKEISRVVMLGLVAGAIMFYVGERGSTGLNRIKTFVGNKDISFQALHGYIAIDNGGTFGLGPGNSEEKNILPHPYSDFIYAVLVEEYGLIGGIVILACYMTLLWRGTIAVRNSSNAFAGLLSAGLSISLVIQAFVNMCVAVGLVPVTGQPLPWISLGGNSIIATGITLGIIQSVSRADEQDEPVRRSAARSGTLPGNIGTDDIDLD